MPMASLPVEGPLTVLPEITVPVMLLTSIPSFHSPDRAYVDGSEIVLCGPSP